MHPLAGLDVFGRQPDRLAVLANTLSSADAADSDLVPQLDGLAELDFAVCQRDPRTGLHPPGGDADVVVRMKRDDVNGRCRGHIRVLAMVSGMA